VASLGSVNKEKREFGDLHEFCWVLIFEDSWEFDEILICNLKF
jgi:hypothetical protein